MKIEENDEAEMTVKKIEQMKKIIMSANLQKEEEKWRRLFKKMSIAKNKVCYRIRECSFDISTKIQWDAPRKGKRMSIFDPLLLFYSP